MYVCMYVCMYVSMEVCIYSMYVCMHMCICYYLSYNVKAFEFYEFTLTYLIILGGGLGQGYQ